MTTAVPPPESDSAPTSQNRDFQSTDVIPVVPDRRRWLPARREFGGMKFGAAFFGWLAARMAVLLTALVAGGHGARLRNQRQHDEPDREKCRVWESPVASPCSPSFSPTSAAATLPAGWLGSTDSAKVAVWLWAVIAAIVVAVFATLAGSRYNILASLNLPRIPVNEGH